MATPNADLAHTMLLCRAGGYCGGSGLAPSDNHKGRAYGDGTDVSAIWAPTPYHGGAPWAVAAPLYGSGTALRATVPPYPVGSPECCGGGYIEVNASVGVQLDGILSADAQAPCKCCGTRCYSSHGGGTPSSNLPCCDERRARRDDQDYMMPCNMLGGASGGTVNVMVHDNGAVLPVVNGSGRVSARGGNGDEYSQSAPPATYPTAGGAGGRVSLPHDASGMTDVDVKGGTSSGGDCVLGDTCECGAAGTIFYERGLQGDAGDAGSQMFVDNGGRVTSAATLLAKAPQVRIHSPAKARARPSVYGVNTPTDATRLQCGFRFRNMCSGRPARSTT